MTQHSQPERIAFWLLPAINDEKPLREMIEQLSSRFGAPVFTPHITLHVAPVDSVPSPGAFLAGQCPGMTPLSLEIASTPEWRPIYNQALTVPVTISDELTTLVCSLRSLPELPGDFFPHISLLYGNIDEESGLKLSREISLGRKTGLFDRIAAIRVGPKTSSAEDVKSWEILETREFR